MTNYQNNEPAFTALANEELESVTGGCYGIPVIGKGGDIVYRSPTTGFPFPGGTLPTFPVPTGPTPY